MIDPRELELEIPAEWFMFASSEDHQTSNEVYNVGNTMNLPDPNGREGGACSAAFLQACYRDERDTETDLSYVGTLRKMREAMADLGFKDQVWGGVCSCLLLSLLVVLLDCRFACIDAYPFPKNPTTPTLPAINDTQLNHLSIHTVESSTLLQSRD